MAIFTSILGTQYTQPGFIELGVLPYIPNPTPSQVAGGPVVGAPWFHRFQSDPLLKIQGVDPPPPSKPSFSITTNVSGGPPILGAPWHQLRVPSDPLLKIQGASPSPPSATNSSPILLAQM